MTSSETDTMILIGQFDSPFVRRVALALRFYGLPFEHRPWSTFGDADKIAPFNPLRRVPTLLLDSGEALVESGAMRGAAAVHGDRAAARSAEGLKGLVAAVVWLFAVAADRQLALQSRVFRCIG